MRAMLLASACAVAQVALALPVHAQTGQAPNTEAAAAEEDEIVVTAERRATNLQQTAIAATVLTGDDLANAGVTTVDQLQFISPGATVNNFGQGIDFNIRGIGKAEHNTQTTTGVITYRDGVATFPGYFTAEPYYDIARVEILRGPQGTFVGQNATGGAVFVTSNRPVINGGVHGYVQGSAGNYNYLGAQGAVNLPISDTLAARVAFNTDFRDSFYDISGPNTGDDGVRTGSGRFSLLWEPTSNLSALWTTDINYLDLSGYPSDPVNSPNDLFEISANADMMALDRFARTVLEVNYEFDNGVTLRSVSGYQMGNTRYAADLDGTSVGVWTFRDSVDETIFSQEFNLISPDDGAVTWILGAYYQHDEYDFLPGEFVIGLPEGSIFSEYSLEGQNPKEGSALFGQVTYEFAPGWELQVGARYAEASTANDISVLQYGVPITQDQEASWDNLSGKVALNWTINDHHFLYGFAATGFRPGGLNVPVGLGPPAPFDEELVTSYEIGWKAGWLDGRLRTQINGFYTEYENFQVIIGYPDFPVPNLNIQLNTPEPTIMYGFEAQVEAVFGAFSLDAGLGLLNSEIGTFYATDPRIGGPAVACDPSTGPGSASCINLEGREQTYAPELTFNVGMQYVFALPGGDTLTPRINFGHVSEQWATLFQNTARGDAIEERNIFNAQLAWTHGDWIATAWATNLTDERYVGAINSGLRFAGPPRQYGIRLFRAF
ncbi:TonB-dependent receptor [Terricaulis sp.]|uniref:TonB-dependent receptor n=1 Tax=Terricaulis sp. TaxID=2768686 RepID=UPI002AC4B71D|nr:TonB-dependent receptor [Terricaulis sp.]MDZ4690791.1 TonB-dependent receptor [Terricaulis sp.]